MEPLDVAAGADGIIGRWSELDPIFIVGRQRTGTSIVWRALREAHFCGFAEGQLWLELVAPFCRLRDPTFSPELRQRYFALDDDRNLDLERRFAVMMDDFQFRHAPAGTRRWVDKSPGLRGIRLSPMLAALFPRSQFIFTYRGPIATVHSAETYVRKAKNLPPGGTEPGGFAFFEATCGHWARAMESWRYVRPLLEGRFIELAQENLAADPDRAGRELTSFVGATDAVDAVSEVFRSRRENTAFPNRAARDFEYLPDWSPERRALMQTICGREAELWGYELNFEGAKGPNMSQQRHEPVQAPGMEEYCHWAELEGNERARELEAELKVVGGLLDRVAAGKVMRAMNWFDEMLGQALSRRNQA